MTDDFKSRQQAGRIAEVAVAARLAEMGYGVSIPAMWTRPSFKERAAYSDLGDLRVFIPKERATTKEVRVEVKSRSAGKDEEEPFLFTCADDYPYGNIFVCSKKAWDRGPKPDVYVIVSQVTGAMICIDALTRKDWVEGETADSARGYSYTTLACPKEHATDFEDWWLV